MRSGALNPQDFAWQGLALTPAAAIHIREPVAEQPGMAGVRLGMERTGCVGFGCVLDSASEPDKDDLPFEYDGTKLLVPLQTAPFIDGTEVGFVHEELNQIFEFHNPEAQNECGCDKSFGVQTVPCLIILKQLTISKHGPAAH